MACITAYTQWKKESVTATTAPAYMAAQARVSQSMLCITAGASHSKGITATTGVVCSAAVARILRINPQYIFLMPGNEFSDNVMVTANVVWHVN